MSHRNAESISRALERYGNTVLMSTDSEPQDDSTLRRRINELFRYLEI